MDMEQMIRLDCLKLAVQTSLDEASVSEILASAASFYRWIKGEVTIQ